MLGKLPTKANSLMCSIGPCNRIISAKAPNHQENGIALHHTAHFNKVGCREVLPQLILDRRLLNRLLLQILRKRVVAWEPALQSSAC